MTSAPTKAEPEPTRDAGETIEQLWQQLGERPEDVALHYQCVRAVQRMGPANEPRFTRPSPAMLGIFEHVICGGIADPVLLSPYVCAALQARYATRDTQSLTALVAVLSELSFDDLFLGLLESTPIQDVRLERFLVRLREGLLRSLVERGPWPHAWRRVVRALALQGFITEFVALESQEERNVLMQLHEQIGRSPAPDQVDVIAGLAMYRHLYGLDAAAALAGRPMEDWPAVYRPLMTRQLLEPLEEQRLKGSLPSLTPIQRTTSLSVAEQYEEHPYPRWFDLYGGLVAVGNGRGWPSVSVPTGGRILVPGCGSGRHALSVALAFPHASVLAVDLSRASLAHGLRIGRAKAIENIEFMQADLLELPGKFGQFDHIDCIGVLHHLEKPSEGWAALVAMLVPGGSLRVGIYSKVARMPVAFLRAEIARLGLRPTEHDMRLFRTMLFTDQRYAGLRGRISARELFGISEFRDLFFHACEHCYSLSEVKQQLDALDLEFCNFRPPTRELRDRYRRQFPDDPEFTSLANWQTFEREYIGSMSMFECTVRRPLRCPVVPS